MKRVFSIILLLSLMLILCSCGGNNEPPVPAYENLTEITMQEYMGDEPVGMEVSTGFSYDPKFYSYPGGTYFYNPGYSDWKQITNDKKLPRRDTSLLLRFTDKSGATTEVFIFGDDDYDYLEIPGAGVWQEKKDGVNDRMPWKLEGYQSLQFSQCYAEPVMNHGRPSLLESYNGSEKAIMVDIREGYADDQWDFHIPDERAAERAEDVRYVFVLELLSKEYSGYWYNAETGQKVSDAYDKTYSMTIYDLVDGSEETLYTGKDIFDAFDTVEEYFSR